ncbi:peptide-methionine (R)-S-oxide reductase MsrB [Candidatus Odyssella acanthamoebae]|uniref:peptide-methionine (R)-S-oxide reductase n=1 Tax=Candidatus Odyssella acanthamoebae TaxID=91604 RepID=A0A077AWC5_9PROT|nr:peptide-methionine (R)-S-oxide reductase MsrB [Candidatus Paracaedibacter acanthamoebae]AIK96731.1 PilB [Candidatus Paracaedibacter acanthamoebae]
MLNWNDIIRYAMEGNPVPDHRVEKTEAEWLQLLTPEEFRITRQKGTEASYSGALCHLYEPGIYACICCDSALFEARLKFDSGTGWPSFTHPIQDNAVKYEMDRSLAQVRVEVMCNTCDSHLGHVFPDGPEPMGLRYCINSVAIQLTAL